MKKQKPLIFNDFVGKPIEIGSIVAYGKALGRCAGINIGVVLKSWSAGQDKFYAKYDPVSKQWIDCEYYKEIPRITLMTNQDDWDDFATRSPDTSSRSYVDTPMKKVNVQFPDRMIVISPEQLGDSALADHFRELSKSIKEEAE